MTFCRSGTFVALLALLLATVVTLRSDARSAEPIVIDLEAVPMQLGSWQGAPGVALDPAARETLRLDRYLRRGYRGPAGGRAALYVGYWKKQTGDYQAAKHSPALCLPANGWEVISSGKRTLQIDGAPLTVNTLKAEYKNRESLFYYWFFNGTTTYTEEWLTLLKISFGAVTEGRSDGGIVEVSTSLERGNPNAEAEAHERLQSFVSELQPKLLAATASADESA